MARNAYEAGLSYFPDEPEDGARVGDWRQLLAPAVALAPIPGASLVAAGIATYTGSQGSSTDAQRKLRVDWTLQQAQAGSQTAAAIIVAAPANVGSYEAPMWRAALSQVPEVVMVKADAQYPGGYWPTGAPDFYTDISGTTHRRIQAEVSDASRVGIAIGSGVAQGINTAVASVSRNPASLVLGVVAVGALGYALLGGRRSR